MDYFLYVFLSQDLDLGIDFWSSFNLLPEFLENRFSCPTGSYIASLEANDPNQMLLTPQQKYQLATVIQLLPSLTEKG